MLSGLLFVLALVALVTFITRNAGLTAAMSTVNPSLARRAGDRDPQRSVPERSQALPKPNTRRGVVQRIAWRSASAGTHDASHRS